MNAQELIETSREREVKIYLHLPEYEGLEFIMIGGAITTRDRFILFSGGIAHLFDDGSIKRYGQKIGTFDDIEVLNIIDAAEQGLAQPTRLSGSPADGKSNDSAGG